jgi:hypothetical protein
MEKTKMNVTAQKTAYAATRYPIVIFPLCILDATIPRNLTPPISPGTLGGLYLSF